MTDPPVVVLRIEPEVIPEMVSAEVEARPVESTELEAKTV